MKDTHHTPEPTRRAPYSRHDKQPYRYSAEYHEWRRAAMEDARRFCEQAAAPQREAKQ